MQSPGAAEKIHGKKKAVTVKVRGEVLTGCHPSIYSKVWATDESWFDFRHSRFPKSFSKTVIKLNVGRVIQSITQLEVYLIDVIIRNQDIKKLETTCFGLTLAIFRFHLKSCS